MEAGAFIRPVFQVRDCGKSLADVKDRNAELYTLSTKLTPEEAASKYAKYYHLGPAEPSHENLLAVERGAEIDPAKAIMPEDYARVMNAPGNMEIETGYCALPNGVGYVAARTFQPGMTDEKMQFFTDNFKPEGDLFYKTWFPGSHTRHYSDMAVEDVGWGMEDFRFVQPLFPKDLGMPEQIDQNDPACFAMNGSNIMSYPLHKPDGEPLYVTELCYYRAVPGGRELRVRFWIGLHYVDGKSQLHLPGGKPVDPSYPRALCNHCIWEFATLTRNILMFWEDSQAGYFKD